jgi:1-acyl-sn-glycerol-3-phosphate acyltransferase
VLSRIRAIWALIAFVLTVSITILLMYLFKKQNRKIRQIWAKMQAYLLGYKIEVKGEISKDAKLLLLNHQSLLDIVVIEDLHPNNTCWVAKKEIEQIPFFGRILDPTRMIAIDRSNRRSLVKLIKEAKDRVESGRVIAIFP